MSGEDVGRPDAARCLPSQSILSGLCRPITANSRRKRTLRHQTIQFSRNTTFCQNPTPDPYRSVKIFRTGVGQSYIAAMYGPNCNIYLVSKHLLSSAASDNPP